MKKKCGGSGKTQMLAWGPDPKTNALDGKPYPGAAICIVCSGGILVRRGTVRKAVSEAGFEGLAGTLRTHYISDSSITYTR